MIKASGSPLLSRVHRGGLLAVIIFLAYTFISLGFYWARSLDSRLDNHILSTEMFGVPSELKARGVQPLYRGPAETGWDGQFYYYISNDILGTKDTPQHVDAASYRYQRVGLSLYAAALSKALGMDWVSPKTFFFSYLLLIAAATYFGARLLKKYGAHPAWILLWSLSVGTQITLFNALPDGAADAFLILALCALDNRRYALSAVPFALSALSREVYTLIPSLIALVYTLDAVRRWARPAAATESAAMLPWWRWHPFYWLGLPGLVAAGWNAYVTHHFGIAPAKQAAGTLGLPLVAWKQQLWFGMEGIPRGALSDLSWLGEAVMVVLFLFVLASALWVSVRALASSATTSPELRGLALSSLCLAVLYLCFGRTVMMHYTGYLKALALFFFVVPLLLVTTRSSQMTKTGLLFALAAALCITSFFNMNLRILRFNWNEDAYTKMSFVTDTQRVECFSAYDAAIKINGVQFIRRSALSRMFGRDDLLVVHVQLTNTGSQPFVSTRSFGSVHMSYHWTDVDGKVVMDGIRSALPGKVLPGQTAEVDIVSRIPKGAGKLRLRPSPVQEGCAWFYAKNPKVAPELDLATQN